MNVFNFELMIIEVDVFHEEERVKLDEQWTPQLGKNEKIDVIFHKIRCSMKLNLDECVSYVYENIKAILLNVRMQPVMLIKTVLMVTILMPGFDRSFNTEKKNH